MWFLFGIVTLLGSCVYAFRDARARARVQGGSRSGRVHYELQNKPNGRQPIALRIGIEVDPSLRFELRHERWLDRLAKALGVVEEPQVGRAEFDRRYFIVSDDAGSRARLRDDVRMADRLAEMVEFDAGYQFHHLWCRDGFLCVTLKPTAYAVSTEAPLFWYERRLAILADSLPAPAALPRAGLPPDRYFLRTVLLLATSTGLLLGGALNLSRLMFVTFPASVDEWQLLSLALPVASALLMLLVVGTVVLLYRAARTPLVMAEVLIIGSLGALMTAYTGVRDLNISADHSMARAMPTQVLERREHRGRRGSRHYSLRVRDWNGEGGPRRIEVRASQYRQFREGSSILVWQHPGFLGVRWIEGISAAPKGGDAISD